MCYETIEIALPSDEEGMVGRECPSEDCRRYFKLRPGTGLDTRICHCPYCGKEGDSGDFHTEDQIEYAKTVALRDILEPELDRLERSLKSLERDTRGGLISLKVDLRREPLVLHRYMEKELETRIVCDYCELEFAVFGVFASCPDCQRLNALTTCLASLEVAEKRLRLVGDSNLDPDISRQFPRDALRDSVAAFDSYGKALRKKYPDRIRRAAKSNLFQDLDALDLELQRGNIGSLSTLLSDAELENLGWLFQARHVYEHNAGVVDERFLLKAENSESAEGQILPLPLDELRKGFKAVRALAEELDRLFSTDRT